jgi:plastocyanin
VNNLLPGNVSPSVKMRSIVASASLAVIGAACGSSASGATGASGAASTSTASAANVVVVQNYKFPPITTTTGTNLTFENRDDEVHTVTANDGSFKIGPFNNKTPTVLVAPSKAGTYPFHCEIHPTMHGSLVVQNP